MKPVAAVLVAAAMVFSGCTEEDPGEGGECSPPEPAFRVNIAAADASIPRLSRITVAYGAGSETHLVSEEIAGPAVFCQWVAESPAAATEPVTTELDATPDADSALHCDLWTSGPAVLDILAPGFVPVSLELRPQQDDCGIVTRDIAVELERPAAET